MIGTLTKLGSITDVKSLNPLRTNSIKGSFQLEPKVGWGFLISNSEPLSMAAGTRVVETSPIKQIVERTFNEEGGQRVVFHTENSVYELIIE